MDNSKKSSAAPSKSALRKRRMRRVLLFILAVGLFCLAGILTFNAYIKRTMGARILKAEQAADMDADCILVLGAGVRDDGTPSHMLEDRLKTGGTLYECGASTRLLMSGDHGRTDYNEVGVMKAYAVSWGVPDTDVFMDHAGFSTYESLYRARDIFGAEKILIVSQGYHLYRALYIAEQLGLEAYGIAADLRTYAGQPVREVREIAARMKDALWCTFYPQPTYLGESIPLSGDGNATNDADYLVRAAALSEQSVADPEG